MSNSDNSTKARRDRMTKLAALPEATIDTSDIPEAPLGAWAQAEIGRFYRPKKEIVTIRLDADVLEHFRRNSAGGRGYQTAINAALRQHVERRR